MKLENLTKQQLMNTLIEVEIGSQEEFLMIRETLTRMGVSNQNHIENDLLLEAEDILIGIVNEIGHERAERFVEQLSSIHIDDPVLYQSCYILHKRGRYYIMHFKELFALDGRKSNMSTEDYARRNAIANKLSEWGMCKLVEPTKAESPVLAGRHALTIISHRQKPDWKLVPKYNIGSSNTANGENSDG